jgi:hypothetical protein
MSVQIEVVSEMVFCVKWGLTEFSRYGRDIADFFSVAAKWLMALHAIVWREAVAIPYWGVFNVIAKFRLPD